MTAFKINKNEKVNQYGSKIILFDQYISLKSQPDTAETKFLVKEIINIRNGPYISGFSFFFFFL